LIGLAYLLFLAGLEMDFTQLRGRLLRLALLGWAVPFALAVVGELNTKFGQLVLAAASIADFGAVILLSLFFSGESGPGSTAVLLSVFAGLLLVTFLVVRTAERSRRVEEDLLRLQDSSAQIRVRGHGPHDRLRRTCRGSRARGNPGLLCGGGAAGAARPGQACDPSELPDEARGDRLRFLHPGLLRDRGHPLRPPGSARRPIEPGHGPDLPGGPVGPSRPPALAYRRFVGPRRATVAGILQATSLPLIVAATATGMELGAVDSAEASALIAAGLQSVLIFPLAGLVMLRRSMDLSGSPQAAM
jgi:hypothetical protein